MQKYFSNYFIFLLLFVFIASCKPTQQASKNSEHSVTEIKFLGECDVPHKMQFKGTEIGGLSGIDYDKENGLYYMICDDRSVFSPIRFYTAKIDIDKNLNPVVKFENTVTLKQKNGSQYPSYLENPASSADPEAMRYNALNKTLVWTSEGERIVQEGKKVLVDPAIIIVDKNGNYIDTFPIPQQLHMSATETGPRRNGVFEGLAFSDDYKTMYVSVEEPLYNDGPRVGLKDTSTWIRIIQYDVASKKITSQYAYHPETIVRPAVPENEFKINGIADIMYVANNKLLVLERSYSTGHQACTIRVYEADLTDASNIINVESLKENPPLKVAKKKLLINMDTLGIFTDNVEGLTFGPVLPNGHRTLMFVSDDNFSEKEKTQFFLFEIIER